MLDKWGSNSGSSSDFSPRRTFQAVPMTNTPSYPVGAVGKKTGSETDDSPPSSITAKKCMELYLHSSSEIKLLSWSKNALKDPVGSQQPATGPLLGAQLISVSVF